jgi:hypothetical protein
VDHIQRAFNKLFNELLSENVAHVFLFLLPFVGKFGLVLVAEPIFRGMIPEKVICLPLLVNLLVFIVKLLELFS